MNTTSVLGVSVNFREAGQGEGVVLLHSAGSGSGQWKRLMERLADRYHVLAPDLFGYGGTGHWPAERSDLIEDEAEIVAAMFDRLDGPAHLVGHSYGGHVAARTALIHPGRIRSLTLIEPSLHYLLAHAGESDAYAEIRGVADPVLALVGEQELEKAAEVFLDYWIGPGSLRSMPPAQRAAVVESMRKLGYQWPFSLTRDYPGLAHYAGMKAPTLLVQGGKTTPALKRLMHILRRLLPNQEFVEIEGAGHMSAATHPDAVNAAIERHLARHGLRDQRVSEAA